MQIEGLGVPRSRYLEGSAGELSREARKRLAWFDHYQAQGRNAALTCRYFGISRQTFYRWKRRYDPQNLRTLEDASRRPQRRLVKTGGRLVKRARYYWLLLAEGHLTRRLFGAMVRRTAVLSLAAG